MALHVSTSASQGSQRAFDDIAAQVTQAITDDGQQEEKNESLLCQNSVPFVIACEICKPLAAIGARALMIFRVTGANRFFGERHTNQDVKSVPRVQTLDINIHQYTGSELSTTKVAPEISQAPAEITLLNSGETWPALVE